MEPRRKRGSTLSLVVTCALFLVVIGLGIDFMLMIFRENSKLVNNTDAVALMMARDAANYPRIHLLQGDEMDNFGPLTKDGTVDLWSYNKLVAQALLAAANAAADGGPEAIDKVNKLIEQLQAPSPTQGDGPPPPNASIGARLIGNLRKASKDFSGGGYFLVQAQPRSLFPAAYADGDSINQGGNSNNGGANNTGAGNNGGTNNGGGSTGGSTSGSSGGSSEPNEGNGDGRGKFGRNQSGGFQSYSSGQSIPGKESLVVNTLSWVDQGGPSNILLDNVSLPFVDGDPERPITLDSERVNHKGKMYLPGYTELKFGGGGGNNIKSIMAMSAPVGEQPHLTSTKSFEQHTNPNFLGNHAVPPNAFKFVAALKDGKGNVQYVVSTGQFGFLVNGGTGVSSDAAGFRPSFDQGYIELVNMGDVGSYDYDGSGTQTTNVFSKELMEGIWLADNGAFSTNKQAILDWAKYNNGDTQTKPAETDANGNLIVHGPTGTIHGLKAPSSGTRDNGPCMWMNTTHGANGDDNFDDECGSRLSDFENAYPPGSLVTGDATSYMAVEQFKQTLRTAFNTCGSFGCPNRTTGLRVYTDGWVGFAPDGVADGRPARNMVNPVPAGSNSKISRAGNVLELLNQVDPNKANKVLAQMKQRMKEIDPGASDSEMTSLLQSKKLELGEVAYIYKADNKLVISGSKPGSMVGDVSNINDAKRKPVGTTQTLSSEYATLGTLVNPQREQEIHFQMYTSFPNPDNTGRALDIAEWTPGVGIYNNLGRLRFKNQCGGTRPSGGSNGGTEIQAAGNFCQPD